MSNQPDAAWVEAAKEAADRTLSALEQMGHVDLELQIVDENDASSTNSVDDEFLDYLAAGRHLTDRFLSGAK